MIFMVLIVLCCVFAIWSWVKPRSATLPPLYPGCLPLIGHAYKVIGDSKHMWEFEKKVYDFVAKSKQIVEFRFGTHPLFVITDPDDGLIVANHCLEKPFFYGFFEEIYDRGLVTARANWKSHRKLLNPAFNLQVLQSFVGAFCKEAKLLVSALSSEAGKGPFNIQPYLITNFLGTACRTTFGPNFDEISEALENYAHATDEIFLLFMHRVQNVWLHLTYIYKWTSASKRFGELGDIVKGITSSVITNRKTELKSMKGLDKDENEEDTDNFVPLLDRMLELADKQDAFDDDEMREHLDTIVAAAYDTSATALTFILVLIGSHPDVQERMVEEIKEVFDDPERDVTRHDLPKLVYMEAVIKEALRLYPPVPRIARTSSTDVKLTKYTLPAKCTYLISVYGLHRHPVWGPDKDQFIPDRWLDPARLPKNPFFFAGFSLGKRNCIGRLYGIMALKTTLVYILRKYRVHGDVNKLETKCDLLMKPESGHDMSIELRV
nr:cytochrome P450 4C1-like [Helicoverpa armigera]